MIKYTKISEIFFINVLIILSFGIINCTLDAFADSLSSDYYSSTKIFYDDIVVDCSEGYPECYKQCPGKGTAYVDSTTDCSDGLSLYTRSIRLNVVPLKRISYVFK
jgi:hypothetical protein